MIRRFLAWATGLFRRAPRGGIPADVAGHIMQTAIDGPYADAEPKPRRAPRPKQNPAKGQRPLRSTLRRRTGGWSGAIALTGRVS